MNVGEGEGREVFEMVIENRLTSNSPPYPYYTRVGGALFPGCYYSWKMVEG